MSYSPTPRVSDFPEVNMEQLRAYVDSAQMQTDGGGVVRTDTIRDLLETVPVTGDDQRIAVDALRLYVGTQPDTLYLPRSILSWLIETSAGLPAEDTNAESAKVLRLVKGNTGHKAA